MQERNVINGATAVFLSEMFDFLYPLRWFGVLAFILIIADLRFGITASKQRGEEVRFSRAVRRTINKMVDYTCWLLLAGAFGSAFGSKLGITIMPEIVLMVIFGVEINSCFSNYFEAKGKNIKVDIFKFFKSKTDIIDVEEKEK